MTCTPGNECAYVRSYVQDDSQWAPIFLYEHDATQVKIMLHWSGQKLTSVSIVDLYIFKIFLSIRQR